MTNPPDTSGEARRIDGLYRAKARAEIAAAESVAKAAGGVRGQGDVLAEVLLVKGQPGPDDVRTKRALSGEDGTAIGKALDALGLPKPRYAFCTRATGSKADASERVRLLTEAIDPRYVVLLDAAAAADFAEAFGAPPISPGVVSRVGGRTVVATDDFEGSLADESAKRRVWSQLRALAPKPGNETDAP